MEGGEDNNEEQFLENQEGEPLTDQQLDQMEGDDDADLRALKEKLSKLSS